MDDDSPTDSAGVTEDALLRGKVRLFQPRDGFRSSLDPVLLGSFVGPPFGRFLDLGAGTGALSFVLAARDPRARGVAVEIQPELYALCRRGVSANGWGDRIDVVHDDARVVLSDARPAWAASPFDLVVTNPPFRPLGEGQLPEHEQRRMAHHELTLTLAEWVAVAARVSRPGGRLGAIFPATRETELVEGLVGGGFHLTRLRRVLPAHGKPAGRVMIEARWGTPAARPGEPELEPDLIVHQDGAFSEEVAAMVEGRAPGRRD